MITATKKGVVEVVTLISTYRAENGVIVPSEIPNIIANDDIEAIRQCSRWIVKGNININKQMLSPEMLSAIENIEDLCRDSY